MRAALTLFVLISAAAQAATAAPLELETKLALGDVSGRIDHLAMDQGRHRLFVAELGNNSIGVIDLELGALAHRITGLHAPQGVGFVAETDTLFVANAGDGSVRLFHGGDFKPVATVDLKDDADNVRRMPGSYDVVVGYGSGGLAILDGETGQKKVQIALKDHPESFQIDAANKRVYVNVPDARQIAVADLASGRLLSTWDKLPARANFPMALMKDGARLAVVFRSPARLAVFNTADGAVAANLPTCGDADDVFFDARRDRLYVSCGEGKIDIYDTAKATPALSAEIPTPSGARTAFYDAAADRYYLAVRAGGGHGAEIWVYRPMEK